MNTSKYPQKKLVKGVFWNTFEKILVRGSSFIIGIILARLLSPADYGMVGMLGVFIAISNIFIESGFAKALIQKQDCKEIDYSTAFISNVGIAIVIYCILFIVSPYIASFYHEPKLTLITKVLSLNFIIGSFNIVQRAKLMKAMDFKSLAQINFFGTLGGGIVGITLAYSNMGVWALIGQTLMSTFIMSILFPFYNKWKPRFLFSKRSFSTLFSFGSKILYTGIVATILNNIATIFIGRYYKSQQLGYYTRAVQYSELLSMLVYEVLGTVSFPVLSELQNDKERMVSVYKKLLFFIALVIFPVMILIALLARPLILLMLTEKWLPCVFLLQTLCLARMFTPLSALNMNILNAMGRSDLYMKLDFSKTPLIIITLIITIPLGVEAIVIGELISTLICFFINAYLPGKIFGYGAWEQIKDWKYILLSLLLMICSVSLFLHYVLNPWIQLLVGGIIGISIYLIACIAFKVITKDLIVTLKDH